MTQHRLTDRTFGLIFAAVFAIFFAVGWFFFGTTVRWLLVASGVFLVLALVLPGALLPLNRLWGVLTARLHRVVNFTLLATFFHFLIVPFGFVIRLFGRDTMHRSPDPKAETYWTPVTRHTDETTLPDMF